MKASSLAIEGIKVGFCVAYDWDLLRHSLPMIYSFADSICISVDKNRVSWSGNRFEFDDLALAALINELDMERKISIYEDDFYVPSLTPMENECRQRNAIAAFMGNGGWHVQLDCDEYFVDFGGFVRFLKSLSSFESRRSNVCCAWITLFKRIEGGFLYVQPENTDAVEFIQVATREPRYEYGRRNGYFNLYTNFHLIHQSWARPETEIGKKIANWGHSADFDSNRYFEFWKSLSAENFQQVKDFHYMAPKTWPSLGFLRGTSIEGALSEVTTLNFPRFGSVALFFRNSKFFSHLRAIRNRIFKSFSNKS